MTKQGLQRTSSLRVLLDLLLSLNAALLIIPVASVRSKYPVLLLGRRMLYFAYEHLPFVTPATLRDDPYGWYVATLALTLTLAIFLLLRIASLLPIPPHVLCILSGLVGIAGLPIAHYMLRSVPKFLLLEIAIFTLLIFSALYAKWEPPFWLIVASLALHFCLWSWDVQHIFWFSWAYPTVGFCSTVLWVNYWKRNLAGRRTASPN